MKTLNLGCGADLMPNAVNVDIIDCGGNLLHDLNVVPYPFPDSHFDLIVCRHVLEHLRDFHKTVSELHRIAKPGARILVVVPFFLNTKYFSEPDHKIPFGIRSFDNYEVLGNRRLRFYERWKLRYRSNYGTSGYFRIQRRRFNVSNLPVLRWLNAVVNLAPVFYERFFAGILSPEECEFELIVLKEGHLA